jgi:two-component system NtrC family sensor kinase
MRETADRDYGAMFRFMVGRMVLVSLLPLMVIGGANFYLFYSLNRSVVLEQHANFLRYHRQSIETFLNGITTEISTLAHQYSLDELKAGGLERAFRVVQQRGGMFTDLGIIDSNGNHVRYVGPYDLADKNYRDTEWFRQVVEKGVYISDMFLGFRMEPHFIVAVKRPDEEDFWILRATVNTDYFSRLVDAVRMGKTGETFIVNGQGFYQTKTRSAGEPLSPSGYLDLTPHEGIRVHQVSIEETDYIYTTTWLDNPRWLLIFRQETSDVYSPLWKASFLGLLMFLVGAAGASLLAVAVARAQTNRIKRADREKDMLTQRLMVAGKAAAVGELSAGLAHEINNPLATIDTLQTLIQDIASGPSLSDGDRDEIIDSAQKIGKQVQRAKGIMQGLLKFSRRVESQPEFVDLNQLLQELAAVASTRAIVEGKRVDTDLEELPTILAPPAHLQQVFANLLNNALDAVSGKPDARVLLSSRLHDGKIEVRISDNGCGIPEENLSRIFMPFFTTKPVGQGTGLGLAICYGLVQELGGSIQVESTLGVGTTFTVQLPGRPATAGPDAGGAP